MDIRLKKVIEFLEEARTKHNVLKSKLEKNGSVFYGNGNDGTNFDWNVNGRLCEFGYTVEDGSVWAFKLLLMEDGKAIIYCYPNGEFKPIDIIKRQLMTDKDVRRLKDLMKKSADDKDLWDCTLEELNLI